MTNIANLVAIISHIYLQRVDHRHMPHVDRLWQVFGVAIVYINVQSTCIILVLGIFPGFCDGPLEELQVVVEGLGVVQLMVTTLLQH